MASTSSSSQILPASSSQSWNYDVFVSYRGEDTRKKFIDHLYVALEQQGIYTYKDDEPLDRGKSIGPSLLKAIKESQIVIVIFSENYADSSWCLDELTYIMKCREEKEKIVIPIFYHVDPSEVRKLKFKYGEAFAKHELENKNKVESWKKALVDASNIAGWEPKQIGNEHEAKCIKEIVDTISLKLHPVRATANENLIGIEARRQDLISKLEMGLGDVLMLGIWGVGGGGKTTLASSVYDEIFASFDGCCFVENIREESTKNGLKELQEKILSNILKQKQVNVERVEEGRHMIKRRLCCKKVLIVLDDVDHLDQLEALAGSHDWFGEGSRIIITTRDEHLLNYHKVDVIHNISLLNNDEAINLFKKHACRAYRSTDGYDLLGKDVISYANGLPLALKVLGSYLCDKNMNEWKSALARLKEIPHNDILGKLEISFDGLQPDEKQMFLDIACFFVGQKINKAKDILDACGFYYDISIRVLIEKALVTINLDGTFDMHDLVQEMGQYIVRREHPKNPEKYSRVWKREDFQNICAMDATTELDNIEVIRYKDFDTAYIPLPSHYLQVIANMKKLRWIEWEGIPESSLPRNFQPKELCCLLLSYCNQSQLWCAYKYLPNLRVIKLCYLTNLAQTPDFNGLPNLERFILKSCHSLKEIHSSIGYLERLVCLDISYCEELRRLPPIKRSQKLETFILINCPNVLKVSEIRQNTVNLRRVYSYWICGCNNLQGGHRPEDVECHSPHNNINNNRQIGLQFFHKSLTKLILSHCNFRDGDIDSIVWELSNLQELDLSGNKLTRLNFGVWLLPRLKRLDVSHSKTLVEVSGLSSSIAVLKANHCYSLESVGDISNCKWLWDVSFVGSHNHATLDGKKLLDSILQGNAIEDHFISVNISGDHIPNGFAEKLVWGNSFKMKLPHNWYNDFSGFLICHHSYDTPLVTITITEERDNDGQSEILPHESNDQPLDFLETFVGYVSFNSITKRQSSRLNLEYNTISIFISSKYGTPDQQSRFAAELVARKSKGDPPQTKKNSIDCADYYHDGEHEDGKTFTIEHHSNSSIKILWDIHCDYND